GDPRSDERVQPEEGADEDLRGPAWREPHFDARTPAEAADRPASMDRALLPLPDLERIAVCEADEFVPRLEHAERPLLGLIDRGCDLRHRTRARDRYVNGPVDWHQET